MGISRRCQCPLELTHPEVVEHLAYPLVVGRDLCGEVLIEAGLDGAPRGQGRPVVVPHCGKGICSLVRGLEESAHWPTYRQSRAYRGAPTSGVQEFRGVHGT